MQFLNLGTTFALFTILQYFVAFAVPIHQSGVLKVTSDRSKDGTVHYYRDNHSKPADWI